MVDVPITFRDRIAGESKLSFKQNVLYLQQLLGKSSALPSKRLVIIRIAI